MTKREALIEAQKRGCAAVSAYPVGGMAFPSDFNWVCINGHDSRAFERTCYSCEWEASQINKEN